MATKKDMDDIKNLGQFIPLHYHFNMLLDNPRMKGFKTAIDTLVRPTDTVLELGCGTGPLSFFAAQRAKKVYSVEFNPELVEVSRRLTGINNNGERIEIIHADATEYVPPEPVQAVVCEMLHVGLLREKQLEVIDAFKRNYQAKYGDELPVFIPGATIQAVQPVQQDFTFEGYYAPVIQFQDPYSDNTQRTKELGSPAVYQQIIYDQPFAQNCEFNGQLSITNEGKLNALRFITKSILAVSPETQQIVDWHNLYMVLPIEEIDVKAGDILNVSFEYPAGAALSELTPKVSLV